MSALWITSVAVAAPLTFNLDGVISDSANQPLEAAAVTFRVDIKNSAEDCLLYREDFLVSMTGSKGYFSIVVGKTANLVAGGAALDKVFANHLTTAIAGQSCTYTPASATETRKVIVSFNDGATSQVFSTQEIQAVPFALQAQAVNGYGTGELLKVAPTVSQISQANSDLNQGEYDEFWRLVKNPLAAYLPVSGEVSVVGGNNKVTNLLGQALPAGPATNGQVLVSNGTAWALQAMNSGSVTSVSGTAPVVVGGTATAPVVSLPAATTSASGYLTSTDWNTFNSKQTSGLASGKILVGNASGLASEVSVSGDGTMDNAGVLSLKNTGTAGTYYKVTTDAQGRVTSGANLASSDITTALGYIPLNKAGGTMGGALNMGGFDITNTGNITMAANQTLGLSSHAADPAVPASGQVWYNSTSNVVKYYNGTSVQSVGGGAAGITSLNGLSSGTQTFAIGTSGNSPAFNSVTSTHTLNIPMASTASVTAGLISKVDYDSFNAKLSGVSNSASLTSGKVWIGNASNAATEITLSGDITGITNAGVVTANKTTTAQANKLLSLDGSGVATTMGNQLNGLTSGSLNLQANAVTTNYSLTFPAAQGSVGQTLTNNGAGVLSWASALTNSLTSGKILVGNASNVSAEVSLSGDATMDNAGVVTLKNTGTPGTYYKVTTDAQGRVTSGANLASSDITTALGFIPVNKAGDSMSGALAMGGFDIANTGNITMAANMTLGLSNNSTDPASPASGQVWYNSTSNVVKYYDGTSVQSLGVAGAGITSLNGLSSGTQSFAIGTSGNSPAFSSATSTHTLNIPMASTASVTAGLISKADYDAFNAKLSGVSNSASLTTGKVWIGNASNAATELALSGDATLANTGVLTVDKTQTAVASKILQLDVNSVAVTKGTDIGGASTGKVSLRYPATGTDTTLTLPASVGAANQVLQTDGAGNLSWATALSSSTGFLNGGNSFAGNSSLGNNDNYNLDLKTNSISRMTILNSGNVGIGTATPGFRLEVNGPAFFNGTIATSGAGYVQTPTLNVNDIYPKDTATDISFFNKAGSEKMRITDGGNIGIGTATPGSSLDVKGTLRLSGTTSGYVGFSPAPAAGATTYTLPTTQGSSGQVLSTDGVAGTPTLSWTSPSAASLSGTLSVAQGGTGLTSFTGYSVVTSNGSGGLQSTTGTVLGSPLAHSATGPAFAGDLLFGMVATPANYVVVSGAATTIAPTIAASGSDANVNLTIAGKGNGHIKLDSAYVERAPAYANASVSYVIPAGSNIARVILSSNSIVTLPSPPAGTNQVFSLTVKIKQDVTGSRTLGWTASGGATIKWDSGLEPGPATAAGNETIYQFLYFDAENIWYASQTWKEQL